MLLRKSYRKYTYNTVVHLFLKNHFNSHPSQKKIMFQSLNWDLNPDLPTPKPCLNPFCTATSFSDPLNPRLSVLKGNGKSFLPSNTIASCTCSCSINVCWKEISITIPFWEHYLWNGTYHYFLLSPYHLNIFHFSEKLVIPFLGRLKLWKVMLPMPESKITKSESKKNSS